MTSNRIPAPIIENSQNKNCYVTNKWLISDSECRYSHRRYFQHAHFIPMVGVGKRGEYYLVHGDLPRQHSFGTTLRFTGPVPADSRQ